MDTIKMKHQDRLGNRIEGSARFAVFAAGLVLVILLVVFMLLRPTSASGTSPSLVPVTAPAAQEPAAVPGRIDRDVPTPSQGLIRIVDELGGEELAIPVDLRSSATDSLILRAGETQSIPPLEPESTLSYGLLSDGQNVVPAEGRIAFSNGTWTIRIPYACRVVVTIESSLLSFIDRRSEVGVFLPPEIGKPEEPVDPGSLAAIFQQQLSDTTFHGAMNRVARKKASLIMKSRCGTQVIPPLSVPAKGIFVIGLLLEDGTAAYSPVELTPGAEVGVFVDLKLRPLLKGILLDWLGEPVPKEEVIFSTALDMLDYDFTPKDAAGIAALRIGGTIYQTTKYSVTTDTEGRFAVRVPRGLDYCIESNARGSRAFWSTRDAGIVLVDSAEVELRLEDPNSDSAVRFQILRESGDPFGSAEAQVSVADDVPYVRQWQKRLVDDKGEISFLGLKPGDLIALMLYHPGLKGTMFVPAYIAVPDNHLVTIVVPNSAFSE